MSEPSTCRFDPSPFLGSGSAVPSDITGIFPAASRAGSRTLCTYIFITEDTPAPAEEITARIRELFERWLESSQRVAPNSYEWRWIDRSASPPVRILSPVEQLNEITMTFSLNASQTAEVFGVSRQTVYDWRGGTTMGPDKRTRLNQLHALARFYRGIEPTPVGIALTWIDESTGQSLLDLFRADDLDAETIRRCLAALPQRVKDHFAEADAAIARNATDGFAAIPGRWREEMRRRSSGRNLRSKKTTGL